MTDYKIAYYVNNNIQHFPPVQRLQEELPGIILVRGEKILEHIQKKYPELSTRTFLARRAHKARALLIKHKIRLVIYPAFQNLYRGLSVEIFHGGLSDKRYLETPFITMYDLVLFPGQKSCDKVKKADLLKYIAQWDIIGYPKFDPLRNNTLSYTPVFNNGRPTVLYAPTWISITKPGATQHRFSEHGESSLPLWGMAILENLPAEVNLIVKFHTLIHAGGNSVHEAMQAYVNEHNLAQRIKIIHDDNILPYMDEAAIMISDISSACYEWFHFDRPIIYANPSPEHYQASDDISSNTYAWQAGDVINTVEDIRGTIEKNLHSDLYQKQRNAIFHYSIFQPDGHATQRQAKAIKAICDKNAQLPYFLFYLLTGMRHLKRWLMMKLFIKNKKLDFS